MLAEAYATMIDRASDKCYFLWDALKDALVMELIDGSWDVFTDLCNLPSGTAARRAMLIQALTEYGQAWRDKAREVVSQILDQERCIDAASISIESSYNLGFFEVLEQMAYHRSSSVRQMAARFVHYLSMENREAAFKILDNLASQVRRNLIPNLRITDFCLQASFLILVKAYKDSDIVERLRRVWVKIINVLLCREWDNVTVFGNLIRELRGVVFNLLTRGILLKAFRAIESDNMETYDRTDYAMFFKRDLRTKQRFTRLIQYIDATDHDIADAIDDLRAVVQSDDLLSVLIMQLVLAVRSMEYDHRVTSPRTNPIIPIIFELLNYGIEKKPASPSVPYLFLSLGAAGRGYEADYVDRELLSLFEDCLEKYYRMHNCVSRNTRGHEAINNGFGVYAQLLYLHDTSMNSQLIDDTISDALSNENYEFLRRYVAEVTNYTGARNVWAMLKGLRPVIAKVGTIDEIELQHSLQVDISSALVQIYIYAPKEVEEFLDSFPEQGGFIGAIRKRVRTSERKETVGAMMTGRAQHLIRDMILLNPDRFLLHQFIWWLGKAPECKNISQWLELLIRLVINYLYLPDRTSVFDTPDLLSQIAAN